ncbi:hypothetical protein Hdeb2414_s0016g00498501 [Helianthus debilis subsp. tardiflorus]
MMLYLKLVEVEIRGEERLRRMKALERIGVSRNTNSGASEQSELDV